jgi:hypothetical protein
MAEFKAACNHIDKLKEKKAKTTLKMEALKVYLEHYELNW